MSKSASKIDALVGVRMRLRRIELGLSQAVLGEKLGVTFQQIQKYENAKNRISAGRLYVTSQALSVPIEYFFEERRPDK